MQKPIWFFLAASKHATCCNSLILPPQGVKIKKKGGALLFACPFKVDRHVFRPQPFCPMEGV
jgi:hypothetical protein